MDKLNKIIYNGKPCRIIVVSQQQDVLLEDENGHFFTVVLSELETITRDNVETR